MSVSFKVVKAKTKSSPIDLLKRAKSKINDHLVKIESMIQNDEAQKNEIKFAIRKMQNEITQLKCCNLVPTVMAL